MLPLLLLHVRLRRQHGDDPLRRCRRFVATADAGAAFPHAHGTHAMGNKGCGGGTPAGGTTCPWQRCSCCRYGNDGRQTMLDHGKSLLKIAFLLLSVLLQFVCLGFSNHVRSFKGSLIRSQEFAFANLVMLEKKTLLARNIHASKDRTPPSGTMRTLCQPITLYARRAPVNMGYFVDRF
jgi:hypothetical protein